MSDKFPVMLASPMKEMHRINFPCIGQTKMDGMRAMIVKENGVVTVYSRNGNRMMKLDEHFKIILQGLDDLVLDGELTVIGEVPNTKLDRKAGNGVCHKSIESVNTISDEEVSRIRITLWDIVPLKDWKKGLCETPYHIRYDKLRSINSTHLHAIVTTHEVEDHEHAQFLFNQVLGEGEEGIILKNTDHPWENKRSKHIVKMKEIIEMDLRIEGFIEGTGKNSNMLGALKCTNSNGEIRVNVGTGFDDATRIDIWSKQDKLLNTIVAVKHNGVITRKGELIKSLFLPVFVELRPDKNQPD